MRRPQPNPRNAAGATSPAPAVLCSLLLTLSACAPSPGGTATDTEGADTSTGTTGTASQLCDGASDPAALRLAAHPLAILADSIRGHALADFDGDGRLDLVAGTGDDVAVFPGLGDGSFEGALISATGRSTVATLAVGDIDGDDDLDVVVGTVQAVVPLINGGLGRLEAGAPYVYPMGLGATEVNTVELADLDGDGNLDVVATVAGAFVQRGVGDGTFEDPVSFIPGGVPDVQPVDLDADGTMEIISAHSLTGRDNLTVHTLEGDTWTETQRVDFVDVPIDLDLMRVAGQDVLVVLGSRGDLVMAELNSSGIGEQTWFGLGLSGTNSVTVGRFNCDQDDDLAWTASRTSLGVDHPPRLGWTASTSPTTLQSPLTLDLDDAVFHVAAGDLNGDGVDDVVAAGEGLALLLSGE